MIFETNHTQDDVFYHAHPKDIDRPNSQDAHYFGDKDFSSFAQFGDTVSEFVKPEKVFELNPNTAKGRHLAYEISVNAYGKNRADKGLLDGDEEAFSELYEAWTDFENVLPVMKKFGLDALKLNNEYVVNTDVIAKLKKVKSYNAKNFVNKNKPKN
jgi:hypothetical protein